MNSTLDTDTIVRAHLKRFWARNVMRFVPFSEPPISATIPGFAIAEIEPSRAEEPWVYVSVGASRATGKDGTRREFLLVAAERAPIHHETLAMLANMYACGRLDVFMGKVIDIGRAWIPGSACDHLLASRPYYQGPDFEIACADAVHIEFLWLTPITRSEAEIAREQGAEHLEQLLEEHAVEVVDPRRASIA